MSQPAAVRSSGVSVFTEPAVPTGMNAGVSTSPWDVVKRPARAPVDGSSASSWNEKGIEGGAWSARDPWVLGTGGLPAPPGAANVRTTRYGRGGRGGERGGGGARGGAGGGGGPRAAGAGRSASPPRGPKGAAATSALAEWPLARCATGRSARLEACTHRVLPGTSPGLSPSPVGRRAQSALPAPTRK